MRAMIVDHSRFARRHVRAMLEKEGFECVEAPDGHAGIEMLHAGTVFDLVLVDWNMPGMNGPEMVRLLRREGFASLRIMMVTTEGDAGAIEQALNAGADEYLMKPFDDEALADKLALMGVREQ